MLSYTDLTLIMSKHTQIIQVPLKHCTQGWIPNFCDSPLLTYHWIGESKDWFKILFFGSNRRQRNSFNIFFFYMYKQFTKSYKFFFFSRDKWAWASCHVMYLTINWMKSKGQRWKAIDWTWDLMNRTVISNLSWIISSNSSSAMYRCRMGWD